jgi:hypothetical protein
MLTCSGLKRGLPGMVRKGSGATTVIRAQGVLSGILADAVKGKRLAANPVKGREDRSVPVPEFVLNELSVQCKGKAPGDLVFGNGGYLQRPKASNGWFRRAVQAAGVQTVTPHDLRHTCASLAVGAGINVLALARMLGHKDPSVTLRVYADLFDTDLDTVAESLHVKYSASKCVQNVSTEADSGQAKPALTCVNIGAGGGTRTLTLSRARAPKARVSANSTTPASPTSVPLTSLTNLSVAPPTVDLLTAAKGLRNAIREGVRSRTGADSSRCKRLRDRASNRVAAKDSVRLAPQITNSSQEFKYINLLR